MKSIISYFDKLEDRIRQHLSRYPIIYAFIGGTGIILFWRGVWHTADMFSFMSGPVTIVISVIILLASGVFVTGLIGHRLIITGLKGEKKLAEMTRDEVINTETDLKSIKEIVEKIEEDLEELKQQKKR